MVTRYISALHIGYGIQFAPQADGESPVRSGELDLQSGTTYGVLRTWVDMMYGVWSM